ncbi:hypothetical protein [Methylobacterium indicum]|uniref:Uncharacterized protein n=1 Tax=Methylobacterium indicum TaxID=1775910 RepID=A0ABR5HID5_9HYPH|nr:hypothetical protein [Methylobacterium indicum]KMO11421.1 hypothetical protein QR78_28565 [Methylobacterium indicum]KMO26392.1 hypothetical protein QR79_02760 [Methylobacterium indicum]
MPRNTLLQTIDAEIAAAEHRTETHAQTVRALLAIGESSVEAEQAFYLELDRLTLLRDRQWNFCSMQDVLSAA